MNSPSSPCVPFLNFLLQIDFIICCPLTANAFLHLLQQLQARNVGCKCLCWKVQDVLRVHSWSCLHPCLVTFWLFSSSLCFHISAHIVQVSLSHGHWGPDSQLKASLLASLHFYCFPCAEEHGAQCVTGIQPFQSGSASLVQQTMRAGGGTVLGLALTAWVIII